MNANPHDADDGGQCWEENELPSLLARPGWLIMAEPARCEDVRVKGVESFCMSSAQRPSFEALNIQRGEKKFTQNKTIFLVFNVSFRTGWEFEELAAKRRNKN